jgi:hypothetical protein
MAMTTLKKAGCTVTLDPLDQYKDYTVPQMAEWLGFLPGWVINPAHQAEPLAEALKNQYGFGPLTEMKGGYVDEAGVYHYPDDEDLYPLVAIERGWEMFYQYPYAIVAIRAGTGETFVTRMD